MQTVTLFCVNNELNYKNKNCSTKKDGISTAGVGSVETVTMRVKMGFMEKMKAWCLWVHKKINSWCLLNDGVVAVTCADGAGYFCCSVVRLVLCRVLVVSVFLIFVVTAAAV